MVLGPRKQPVLWWRHMENRIRKHRTRCFQRLCPKWYVTTSVMQYLYMGRVKRKSVFKHALNAQIQIVLRMRKVLSGPLLSTHTFFSSQWFCYRTVKALIAVHICLKNWRQFAWHIKSCFLKIKKKIFQRVVKVMLQPLNGFRCWWTQVPYNITAK